ncbi:hypothetical protein PO250_02100 [Limosilactobacillus mucosae]|uniref:Uncharacterized protein n=1 Tax=Limosilactobacillus mucosae TaxID=97478 RepID=A0AAJ1HR65_LIMMU|nr:hypothetical protein [Limosilactobacillus mucosae]MDC2829129.1 hypothetical protein [Limosilactobacillus mucosae]
MENQKQKMLSMLDQQGIWYLDATTYNEVECEPELPAPLNKIFNRLLAIAESKAPQDLSFDGFVNEGNWLAVFCDDYGKQRIEIQL